MLAAALFGGLLLLATTAPARAESPGVLPKGSEVVYAGGGFTSFSSLTQGDTTVERDRELRFRGDLYGSFGLTDRLQVSASVPLIYSTIADDSALLPCPNLLQAEGHCESYFTVGQARLDGRVAILQDKVKLTGGLAGDIDAWNQSRRGQYNSAGSGRTVVEAFAVTGGGVPAGEWRLRSLALFAYGQSLAPEVSSRTGESVKALGSHVRGSVELRAKSPGPLAFELGIHHFRRLSGVALDTAWIQDWFLVSQDRWNVLAYQAWNASGKVSVDLPNHQGLHLGAARVVSVDNGPTDLFDVSLGWHRYFAP